MPKFPSIAAIDWDTRGGRRYSPGEILGPACTIRAIARYTFFRPYAGDWLALELMSLHVSGGEGSVSPMALCNTKGDGIVSVTLYHKVGNQCAVPVRPYAQRFGSASVDLPGILTWVW